MTLLDSIAFPFPSSFEFSSVQLKFYSIKTKIVIHISHNPIRCQELKAIFGFLKRNSYSGERIRINEAWSTVYDYSFIYGSLDDTSVQSLKNMAYFSSILDFPSALNLMSR